MPVPEGFHLDEIWKPGVSPAWSFRKDRQWLTWHNIFLSADWFLKWWERSGSKSIRRKAIEKAREWMIERLHHSEGLGAIYPPMMYSVMALDVLGYAKDHPLRVEALRQFNNLMVDDGDRFFFQPCFSPVWDTGIGLYALAQTDPEHPALRRAADWLLDKEVRRKGDWSVKRPNTEPSGWAFEYSNEFYPDIDDTAMVMLALGQARSSNSEQQQACHRRALDWLFAMQSSDGGWAAFDADNNWEFLNKVPFADHNAMLDPTCPDITGRVLEALAAHGVDAKHRVRPPRRGVAGAKSAARWKLVRPLGCGLYLRNLLRAARLGRFARRRSRSACAARRRMAAVHPECRWRLGRKLRQLR